MGSYPNTSSTVSSTNGGTGNSASDTLKVEPVRPAISLSNRFPPPALIPGLPSWAFQSARQSITGSPLKYWGCASHERRCHRPYSSDIATRLFLDRHSGLLVANLYFWTNYGRVWIHPNTATASGTYSGSTYSDTSTATYATTGLTLVKSASPSTYTTSGELISYSYLVTNSGFAPLVGHVTINDDKSINESCPLVNTVGDLDNFLDPGESVTCTATYAITGADITALSVTNTATASADGVTSNTDSKTVTYLAPPTVAKVFVPSTISAGGTSLLIITLNNPGDESYQCIVHRYLSGGGSKCLTSPRYNGLRGRFGCGSQWRTQRQPAAAPRFQQVLPAQLRY